MEKILIVDDENINILIVKKILSSDYEVLSANSGEAALEILESETPSLILLDIHMPGLDGYATLERIRHIPRLENIPIVFLTADDDANAEVKGFEMGAEDFIKKPFVSAVVKRRVERCIDMFHLHCSLQDEVNRQTMKAEKRRMEVENLSKALIETLVTAIDAKDIYTKGHSSRVAEYSALLAKKLGWSEKRIEMLRYKALLHDIGKIGIPDRVLNKNGRLTDEEFGIIKQHTIFGGEVVKGVSNIEGIYEVVRYHHERFDGKGYPDGLVGKDIPEEARLVGIADAYDAMSSDRVYRKSLPDDIIEKELLKGRGYQFDPEFLDVFYEMFKNGELAIGTSEAPAESVETDIKTFINDYLENNNSDGATQLTKDEFSKVYKYLDDIRERYGLRCTSILISLTADRELENEELEVGMKAMEYSIVQSLRKVDIVCKASNNQFLIVLIESDVDNVHMIVDRIYAGFYKNCQNQEIKPIYEM